MPPSQATACTECGGELQYVSTAPSRICVDCGIICNPAQYVLVDEAQNQTEYERSGATWHGFIPGYVGANSGPQTATELAKEQRHRRNEIQAHSFIRAALNALGCQELNDRVTALFDSSMAKGKFKWGSRATCIIGACIMIAARENNKAETFKGVAARLNMTTSKLSTTTLKILQLHDMHLDVDSPLAYIPTIIRHVSDILANEPSVLPESLRAFLAPIPLHAVQSLAADLCDLTELESLNHNRIAPPVACAMVILALEGERRQACPCHAELAEQLCRPFQVHSRTAIDRYVEAQELLCQWKVGLPWLAVNDVTKPKRGKKRKASLAQREEHAGLIKDIVAFRDELWKKTKAQESNRAESQAIVAVDTTTSMRGNAVALKLLEVECDDEDGSDVEIDGDQGLKLAGSSSSAALSTALNGVDHNGEMRSTSPPAKRRRVPDPIHNRNTPPVKQRQNGCIRPEYAQRRSHKQNREVKVAKAAWSLLGGMASSPLTEPSTDKGNSGGGGDESLIRRHVLSAGIRQAVESAPQPSRLEGLSRLVGEANIPDDLLFDEGELDGYLRSEEEASLLRFRYQQVEQLEHDSNTPKSATKRPEKMPKMARKMDFGALEQALEGVGPPFDFSEAVLHDFEDERDGDERLSTVLEAVDTPTSPYDDAHHRGTSLDLAQLVYKSISYDPYEEFEEV